MVKSRPKTPPRISHGRHPKTLQAFNYPNMQCTVYKMNLKRYWCAWFVESLSFLHDLRRYLAVQLISVIIYLNLETKLIYLQDWTRGFFLIDMKRLWYSCQVMIIKQNFLAPFVVFDLVCCAWKHSTKTRYSGIFPILKTAYCIVCMWLIPNQHTHGVVEKIYVTTKQLVFF